MAKHLKLTAAEKQRRYRERRRQNKEKDEANKAKDRERYGAVLLIDYYQTNYQLTPATT